MPGKIGAKRSLTRYGHMRGGRGNRLIARRFAGGVSRRKTVPCAPTWEGQNLADCGQQINTFGLQAFLTKSQHVPVYIEQEGGSAGEFVIDAFQRRVLPGYAVSPVKPVLVKEVRAQPFASACEAGNVFLVQGPWN